MDHFDSIIHQEILINVQKMEKKLENNPKTQDLMCLDLFDEDDSSLGVQDTTVENGRADEVGRITVGYAKKSSTEDLSVLGKHKNYPYFLQSQPLKTIIFFF